MVMYFLCDYLTATEDESDSHNVITISRKCSRSQYNTITATGDSEKYKRSADHRPIVITTHQPLISGSVSDLSASATRGFSFLKLKCVISASLVSLKHKQLQNNECFPTGFWNIPTIVGQSDR